MDKEAYQYYKERGVCPKCKSRDAAPDHVVCARCLYSIKKYQRSRDGWREAHNKIKATARAKRKAAGLCIDCGNPVSAGHTRCDECLYFKRVAEKIKCMRQKKGAWDGLYSKTVIDKMSKGIVAEFLRRGWFDSHAPEQNDAPHK